MGWVIPEVDYTPFAWDLKVSESGNSKRSCNILIIGVLQCIVQPRDDVSVHFFLDQLACCSTSIYIIFVMYCNTYHITYHRYMQRRRNRIGMHNTCLTQYFRMLLI